MTPEDRKAAQIARINELSQLARTAWFSLLGYLVFVGITLLGVKDADFFVPSRQTDLPLVNVAIPTASFFWIAPILGAALYTYLHLFLTKLWEAHAEARTTDADPTHHWLVGDFVLIRQSDPTTRLRALSWLIVPITILLVWVAGPIVLAYAWWRSMPAHNEVLTLVIAACLWLTLVAGFTSWWHAELNLRLRFSGRWATFWRRATAVLAAFVLVTVSWLRTEGGFDRYVAWGWTLDDVSFTIPAGAPVVRWFTDDDLVLPLARTDLAGEELVPLPADWRARAPARGAFRETWCRREGIAMDACAEDAAEDAAITLTAARQTWCDGHGKLLPDACQRHFEDVERRFKAQWEEERSSALRGLPDVDLSGRDLRHATLERASLSGAVLTGAQMQEANLSGARLEGAYLDGAQLQRANLSGARLDGARLGHAQLKGANLDDANLENVIAYRAELEGASLWRARLSQINLSSANLQGADLRHAHLEGAKLEQAKLEKADLGYANMTGADLSQAKLMGATMVNTQLRDANLNWAHLEGSNLMEARLDGSGLLWSHLDGSYLDHAVFIDADLTNTSLLGSLAFGADFRGVSGLTQGQLDETIGDAGTLLTDDPNKQPLYVWSCWEDLPVFSPTAEPFVEMGELRPFLCDSEPRYQTGTTLALHAPRPTNDLLGPGN